MTNSLENKTIISTRPFNRDAQLIDLLTTEGANYISLPMIAVEMNELTSDQKNALINLQQFDWVIFTSINGVQFFFEHLKTICSEKIFPPNLKTAVVGHSTKKELEKFGVEATLVSDGNTSMDFLKHLNSAILENSNQKLLLPFGNLAGDLLELNLKSKAQICRINVYNTVAPRQVDSVLLRKIILHQYDLILLSSPSAFYNLKMHLGASFPIKELRVACIGPVTEKALTDYEVIPQVVAESSTAEGLFESVKKYFQTKSKK